MKVAILAAALFAVVTCSENSKLTNNVQKAVVVSHVNATLKTIEAQGPSDGRNAGSLLYGLGKRDTKDDASPSSSSSSFNSRSSSSSASSSSSSSSSSSDYSDSSSSSSSSSSEEMTGQAGRKQRKNGQNGQKQKRRQAIVTKRRQPYCHCTDSSDSSSSDSSSSSSSSSEEMTGQAGRKQRKNGQNGHKQKRRHAIVTKRRQPYCHCTDSSDSSSSDSSSSDSSSSSSSSSEEMNGQNDRGQQRDHDNKQSASRQRRSVLLDKKQNKEKKKKNQKDDSSSSSSSSSFSSSSNSSSSSSSLSSGSYEDDPKSDQLSIFAINLGVSSAKDLQDKLFKRAAKVAQDIAQEKQYSNSLLIQDTLTKYNILVRFISSMNWKQLQQFSQQYEQYKQVWRVVRDAVSQSGTMPAFQMVKSWIEKKQIQGEEAAEVVSVLALTLRYPTEKTMSDFFDMAMSQTVRQQRFLNSSALVACTRFINMAHVNNKTAHSYYPTDIYGRLTPKNYQIVSHKVLPALSKELQSAMKKEDSQQAQVYIEAIGNLGHPQILDVFAPYLKGKHQVSTFLRTQIVKSLAVLATQRPHLARTFLFNIYQNTGEHYEVRVAAVQQIMKSKPTRTMLEHMAHYTNIDTSNQVRAAVKYAITSASQLDTYKFQDLSDNAKAALPLLTSEDFSIADSTKYMEDFESDELNLGYFLSLALMGSDDSVLPKGITYSFFSKLGGWINGNKMSFSASSIRDIIDAINDMFEQKGQGSHTGQGNFKWSAHNISKLLNIRDDDGQKIEGNFLLHMLNQQRMFAFDESLLQQIPSWVQSQHKDLQNGIKFDFSKFYNREQVSIMFPLAMGFPFKFDYQSPSLVDISGHVQARFQPEFSNGRNLKVPQKMEISTEIKAVYAVNFDGRVGFINNLDGRQYFAGIVSRFQANLPLKSKAIVDFKNGKIQIETEPLNASNDATLIHYSVKPFTTFQKMNSFSALAQEKDYKEITNPKNAFGFEKVYGERETGMAFKVHTQIQAPISQRAQYNWDGHSWMSMIAMPEAQRETFNTNFTLKYYARKSTNKKVATVIQWGSNAGQRKQMIRRRNETFYSNSNRPSDTAYGSESRQKEMLNIAAFEINNAEAYYVDAGIRFEGKQKSEYVATLAWARSNVDAKRQSLFYFNKKSAQRSFEICANGQTKMPNTPELNFHKALEFDASSYFLAQVKYGEKCDSGAVLSLDGKLKQSQKRKQYLKKDPITKLCEQQMKEGVNQMSVCENSAIHANFLDRLEATIEYADVGPIAMNLSYAIYKAARNLGSEYVQENFVNPTGFVKPGKIELKAQLNEDLRYIANISIVTAKYNAEFSDIPINQWAVQLVAIHPNRSPLDRTMNFATNGDYTPTCVLDNGMIRTFSNKTYHYNLGQCWHGAVVKGSGITRRGQQTSQEQLTIMVRDTSSKDKEAQIQYSNEGGDILSIEFQPGSRSVTRVIINGQQQKLSQTKAFELWGESDKSPLVQAYALPGGEAFINIDDSTLRVIYDGQRVKVIASEDYRYTTSGLCGVMSGEQQKDLTAPQNYILREGGQFGASYALTQNTCEGPTEDPQRQQSYYSAPQNTYPTIFGSRHATNDFDDDSSCSLLSDDDENSKTSNLGQNVMATRSYLNYDGSCNLERQVQFFEKDGQICITLRPLPACNYRCRSIQQEHQFVKVVCRPSKDQQFRIYREQLRSGNFPTLDENKYQATTQVGFKIPQACQA